ncbi:TetR/AcrR family transcriptional regulator [Amycolatopsis circi]|uniref:TetR/AcrR family transcriptional regulator n=1 Tax=Amycolatopsis circi TaxID=871959 RepID=UPI0013BEA7F5|nr:TetR family transcriptional regulator [Amycolatopsis circi]
MPGRRGATDPRRRDKIVAAAEAVVIASGVAGLTHRSVAQEADVPLGSTTYYFATLGELRQAALRGLLGTYREWLLEWADTVRGLAGTELASALADEICRTVEQYREHIAVEYELTVLALRDAAMGEVAAEYAEFTAGLLAGLVGEKKAFALSAMLDGLYLRALTERRAPSRTAILAALSTVLGE